MSSVPLRDETKGKSEEKPETRDAAETENGRDVTEEGKREATKETRRSCMEEGRSRERERTE